MLAELVLQSALHFLTAEVPRIEHETLATLSQQRERRARTLSAGRAAMMFLPPPAMFWSATPRGYCTPPARWGEIRWARLAQWTSI